MQEFTLADDCFRRGALWYNDKCCIKKYTENLMKNINTISIGDRINTYIYITSALQNNPDIPILYKYLEKMH